MAGTLPAPSVTDDYAQRVTKDLAENKGEQERVRAELARLQSELVELEKSEVLLTKMQEVLGGAPKPPTKKKGKSKAAAVPAARSNSEMSTKKAQTSGRMAGAQKGAPPRKSGEPTWLDRTTAYLAGQSEPKSAAEVTSALAEAHPERAVLAPVVRNALEQGVAQGRVERSKQGRSVFYTSIAAAAPESPDTAQS
ncbi:hypothetical protein PUR49_00445 [Streptomyces sp. BE147]|uniref:hypothetical protein n=1 Tax=Streptomyces sp. BE147 TaxID=3002524 RepID=UPI002E774045|nr:hypothetical protein [Streptomyces sp. BE147]MEE1735041.1 hypothetical protein [Streptomyces sp. BE147]